MTRESSILATLVIYNLCLIGIGLVCQRRTHSGVDFYLGGRHLGPLVAAISASASSSSAWTLLGVSGAAYAWGFSAIWLFPSCVGGFILNWYLLAPALGRVSRKEGSLTVTEVIVGPSESDLRRTVTILASMIILISLAAYVASQFQGAGKTFSETFGISLRSSILIGAAVVVFYTMLGGFWAVSVTDTLQGLLMAISSIMIPLAAVLAAGGPVALFEGMVTSTDPSFASLTRGLPAAAALGFILGLLGIGLGYPGQPHVVNRFMAIRAGDNSLRKARIYAILWAIVVYSGMLLLGWSGRLLVPHLSDPEVVFINLTNQLFHPVLSGVVLAAVLSAIMSTADSQLLVASSAVTHDLGIGERSGFDLLARSRIVVLLLSLGATFAALYGTQEIFSQVLFAWAAMGSAFGPLLLVSVLKGRLSGKFKVWAILTGFILSVGAFYVFPSDFSWKGCFQRTIPFFAALTIALAGLLKKEGGKS